MTEDYGIAWTEAGAEIPGEPGGKKDLDYIAPVSLAEAEKLKQSIKGYHYLAGGTILNWKGSPRVKGLIDLKHLHLENITVTGSEISTRRDGNHSGDC